jgi:hypothetical protein
MQKQATAVPTAISSYNFESRISVLTARVEPLYWIFFIV